jgi:hypothetical protein
MPAADIQPLQGLLKRLALDASAEGGGVVQAEVALESTDRFDASVHELVLGVYLHHSTLHAAHAAMKRLRTIFADLNDLRVAQVHEIAEASGERAGPLRDEHAMRARAVLQDLFSRECDLSFGCVREMKSAEARDFVLGLDGCTPCAAMRVLGLHFGQSVVAVDERALFAMREAGVISAKASEVQAATQLGASLKGLEPAMSVAQASRLIRELAERTQLPKVEESGKASAGKPAGEGPARSTAAKGALKAASKPQSKNAAKTPSKASAKASTKGGAKSRAVRSEGDGAGEP